MTTTATPEPAADLGSSQSTVAWRLEGLRRRRGAAAASIVMPTAPPRPGRWRRNAAGLAPVLARSEIRDVAVRLGYPRDPGRWR